LAFTIIGPVVELFSNKERPTPVKTGFEGVERDAHDAPFFANVLICNICIGWRMQMSAHKAQLIA
jgi:hypothetical protein